MALPDLLSAAYAARMLLQGEASPSWPATVAAIAALPDTTATLTAERDRLAGVQDRCVVSRVRREALDEALTQRG
jgi:hypothetical protein